MLPIHKPGLWIMILVLISLAGFASTPSAFAQEPEWWTKQKKRCGLPSNLAYNSWNGRCPADESRNNSGDNNSDNGDAVRQAEEKRKADEKAAAYEAERQRRADEAKARKETADRQKAFEKDRDETLQLLRGSGGNTNTTDLRGVDSTGTELRGSSNQNTGLRGSTPSGDPMVVDAQNVSSGMSRNIDNAIADLYKDAPEGVADRVSKGFQAVMKRKWDIAKVWFLDALNQDPTNIGIKRFAALCDYTFTHPNPTMSAAERQALSKILSGNADQMFAEDFDRWVNSFNRNYAPRHPELKIVVPARPAPTKKDESPVDKVLRRIHEFVRQPRKPIKYQPGGTARG